MKGLTNFQRINHWGLTWIRVLRSIRKQQLWESRAFKRRSMKEEKGWSRRMMRRQIMWGCLRTNSKRELKNAWTPRSKTLALFCRDREPILQQYRLSIKPSWRRRFQNCIRAKRIETSRTKRSHNSSSANSMRNQSREHKETMTCSRKLGTPTLLISFPWRLQITLTSGLNSNSKMLKGVWKL